MADSRKRLDDFFKQSSANEPEELKKYYQDLNKGVDPNKQTATDKFAMFFKNLAQKAGVYYPVKKEKKEVEENHPLLEENFVFTGRSLQKDLQRSSILKAELIS